MAKKTSRRRKSKTRPETVKFPETFKDDFRRTTFRTAFTLHLTQPMIEFLCAAADNVSWDRAVHEVNIHRPDNWVATSEALVKRGLLIRKPREETDKDFEKRHKENRIYESSYYRLTPAGDAIVTLFKVTGVFVEADAAITKRTRKRG